MDQVRKRMTATCTEIMEKEDHQEVLAVSHAGACLHFLSVWQDPSDVLRKGVTNCCIFKYSYDANQKSFELVDVIRPDFK